MATSLLSPVAFSGACHWLHGGRAAGGLDRPHV